MTTAKEMYSQMMLWDPFDPQFLADPYPTYEKIRESGPIQRTPSGIWVATGYQEVATALRSPHFGHPETPDIAHPIPRTPEGEPMISFQLMNPPDHTRLRNLVSKPFNARMIEGMRPRVQRIIEDLLDPICTGEPVDFIGSFAYPLPLTVICELIGVPEEDRTLFRKWANALARGLDPDIILSPEQIARRDEARLEFFNYFLGLAARRRAEPQDDLMTSLVRVEDAGDTLSATELAMTCILILIAGHETTVNLMGNGTLALLRHPDQMAYLREHPDDVGAAVEELLRFDPAVQFTARIALQDSRVGEQEIRAGEMIVLSLGAANRDPGFFPEPDRLDLSRPVTRHVAFGLGIHFCLGLPLAKLEGELAFTELARRRVELVDRPLEYKENLTLRGLSSLPLRLRAG